MSWFYYANEQRVGPVEAEEIRELVHRGELTPEALVWTTGMADWASIADCREALGLGAPPPGTIGLRGRCSGCGGAFPAGELVTIGDGSFCADCKPVAVQRLREGVPVAVAGPAAMHYAGFWIRFAAYLIDYFILLVPSFAMQIAAGVLTAAVNSGSSRGAATSMAEIGTSVLVGLMQVTLSVSYKTWFVGRYGATPGKMATGLRIVRSDGSKVTYMRSFGRAFAEMLSCLIVAAGYIMVAFDEEKRGLHDHLCDTRVVYK